MKPTIDVSIPIKNLNTQTVVLYLKNDKNSNLTVFLHYLAIAKVGNYPLRVKNDQRIKKLKQIKSINPSLKMKGNP